MLANKVLAPLLTSSFYVTIIVIALKISRCCQFLTNALLNYSETTANTNYTKNKIQEDAFLSNFNM